MASNVESDEDDYMSDAFLMKWQVAVMLIWSALCIRYRFAKKFDFGKR